MICIAYNNIAYINFMKIIVKFSEDIGQTSLEKEVSPNDTVENL